MAWRWSRRDVLKIGVGAAGGLGAPRGAEAQAEAPKPPRFRPRARPPVSGRVLQDPLPEGLQRYRQAAEAAVAEPFKGLTTDGRPVTGLFRVETTGVSTRPIQDPAAAFLAALPAEQA